MTSFFLLSIPSSTSQCYLREAAIFICFYQIINNVEMLKKLQSPLREVEQSLLLATIAATTKKLRDMFISEHVTLGNDSFNLRRNKIARQVAKKTT